MGKFELDECCVVKNCDLEPLKCIKTTEEVPVMRCVEEEFVGTVDEEYEYTDCCGNTKCIIFERNVTIKQCTLSQSEVGSVTRPVVYSLRKKRDINPQTGDVVNNFNSCGQERCENGEGCDQNTAQDCGSCSSSSGEGRHRKSSKDRKDKKDRKSTKAKKEKPRQRKGSSSGSSSEDLAEKKKRGKGSKAVSLSKGVGSSYHG